MKSFPRLSARSGAAVLLLGFVLTTLIAARTALLTPESQPVQWANPYDHHKYVYMAEHPVGSFHIDPPAKRIIVPLLVRLTGLGPQRGFFLIAFVSIWLTGFVLFHVLAKAGYTRDECWLGMLAYYSYGAATKLLLMGMYNPDAFHHLLIAAALWLMYTRRDLLLAALLALGAAVKETTILIPILCYTLRTPGVFSLRHAVRALAIFLAPLAVILTLGALIETRNEDAAYVAQMGPQLTEVHMGTARHTVSDALARVGAFRLQMRFLDIVRELTFSSLGIFFLLPFFALRTAAPGPETQSSADDIPLPARMSNLEVIVRTAPLYASIYFAYWMSLNFDRRLALAAPFTIMMCLNGIRRLSGIVGVSAAAFLGVFAVQFLLLLAEPRSPAPPFDFAVTAFVLSLAVSLQFFRRSKDRQVSAPACG